MSTEAAINAWNAGTASIVERMHLHAAGLVQPRGGRWYVAAAGRAAGIKGGRDLSEVELSVEGGES